MNIKDEVDMRQTVRHMLIATLFALLAVLLTSHQAFANVIVGSGVCGNVSWTLDDDGLLVLGSDGAGGTIPSYEELGTTYPDYYPWMKFRDSLKKVVIRPGVKASSDLVNLFCTCNSLEEADVSNLDTSSVTRMLDLFGGCPLTTLDLSGWDTSSVESLAYAFEGCSSLTTIDLSGWTMESVTSMKSMFAGCESLTSLDVSDWDTDNVTDMACMFEGCKAITSLNTGDWDTLSVTDMTKMFYNCNSLENLDVTDWYTGNVTDMYSMFDGCSSLKDLDVTYWNTENVTDMGCMFEDCSSLTKLNTKDWVTSSVETMSWMFFDCSSLELLSMADWDTSSVKSMVGMFSGCTSLSSIDLSGWNMQSVTSMDDMFNLCCPSKWSIGGKYQLTLDSVPERSATYSIYEPERDYMWWSVSAQAWFSRDEIVEQRSGIADTYTNGEDGIDPDGLEHYPVGYSFNDDSYAFDNYGTDIAEYYFTTLYERGAGKLFANNARAGGVCYGMSNTTASILNCMPVISKFSRDGTTESRIRDLVLDVLSYNYGQDPNSPGSVVYVNNKIGTIRLSAFIKYAHISQLSVENQNENYLVSYPAEDYDETRWFLKYVKSLVDDGDIGLTIGMSKRGSAHRVLVIGYTGNSILVDDPNNPNEPERLTISDDGSWTFSGFGSFASDEPDAALSYSDPNTAMRTWRILTSSKAKLHPGRAAAGEEYLDGMEHLSADSMLVRIDADDYQVEESDAVPVGASSGAGGIVDEAGVDTDGMYWIQDSNEVSVSGIEGGSRTVDVGADNMLVSTAASKGADVSTMIDGVTTETTVSSSDGNPVSVSCTMMGEELGSEETLAVSGVAAANDVTVRGGEDSYVVAGLDDLTLKAVGAEGTTETHVADADGVAHVVRIDGGGGNLQINVEEASLERANVVLIDSCTYTGKPAKPVPTVKFEGVLLREGTDYELVYANNDRAGTASVTIRGIGAYPGSVTREFKIKPENLGKARIDTITSKIHTGKAITPLPTVRFNGVTLKSGIDYVISYKNNSNVGTATVTVTGKGNYSGKTSKTFTIVPKGTKLSKVKATSRGFTVKWKKQASQTKGYQLQCSTSGVFKSGNKIVTVPKASTVTKSIAGLKAKKVYYVRVRTYRKIGGKMYYSSWSAKKKVKTK